MQSYHILIVLLFTFIAQVVAHGYLKSVSIDGQLYEGNAPNQDTQDSPIRLIDTIDPVKGTSNPNLSCGQDAQNAALVVPANPGSQVAFTWSGGGGGNWPHNTGPLMTYMALCDGTTCDKFNASNANWFKIDEAGLKSDGSGWWQVDISQGKSYTVTLPEALAPGDYLIRHEIISLQIAVSVGGAEFYPSCTQVRVGGNANGTPSPTVHFPGAYSDTDPGIYTPDVYNPGFVYVFPGPDIASFGTGTGNGSASESNTATTAPPASTTAFTSAPSSTATPITSDVPISDSGSSSIPTSTFSAAPSPSSTSSSGSCWDEDSNNWARDSYRPRRGMYKLRRSRRT